MFSTSPTDQTAVQSLTLNVPESALQDLWQRLQKTRFPDQINDADWSYGAELDYMRGLCRYWAEQFDWRAVEQRINRFNNLLVEVDGQPIHCIHQRSSHPQARPLILTHGWPGSFVEFLDVIEPLVDPVAHGGAADDAFHIICPSLPGFGLSPSATEPGMNIAKIAQLWAGLMETLGYDQYFAQGGDWGAMVSAQLARIDPEHCRGIHINLVIPQPPEDPEKMMEGVTEQEVALLGELNEIQKNGMGYIHIQSTRPQTLAYGLADSPAGQAAWITEKFRAWSDCGGDIEQAFSKDQLLSNIALYWFSNTGGSSARIYLEETRSDTDYSRVEVPTAVANYPGERMRSPRVWAERGFNLRYWSYPEKGGHFAAMEQPALFVEDVRQAMKALHSTP